jgi:hypothetical protein
MRKAMAKMLLELLWKLSTMVGSFEHIYLLLLLNYLPFLFVFPIHSLCNYTFDHMSGVMVNVLNVSQAAINTLKPFSINQKQIYKQYTEIINNSDVLKPLLKDVTF